MSLLSCSPGEWAGRHSSAAGPLLQGHNFGPLAVPHTMCHHCTGVIDEQGLLTPLMREVLIHVDLVWDPLGRVCRDAVTSAPSHPLPTTFHLLKTFAVQPRQLSFSVYWSDYSAHLGWFFKNCGYWHLYAATKLWGSSGDGCRQGIPA